MNKKIMGMALIATFAVSPVFALADATSTATSTDATTTIQVSTPVTPGSYVTCVPVSTGYYCPTEQARTRLIALIKAEIAELKAEIALLLKK